MAALAALPAVSVQAQVVVDGSMDGTGGPSAVGPGTVGNVDVEYLVRPEIGRISGSNLLHSFTAFSVGEGETAAFTGPASVENVIARVTGHNVSQIDGRVWSTVPDANLFLINPSGIVIGETARFDVDGALHLSTADDVRDASGERFSASTPSGSSLIVDTPVAFGFLNPNPAGIQIDAGASVVHVTAERFGLVGGDVTIRGDTTRDDIAFVWVPETPVQIAAVAARSGRVEVVDLDSPDGPMFTGDALGRTISFLDDVTLTTSALRPRVGTVGTQTGAGDIFVRGGDMIVRDAEVFSLTAGSERGGDIRIDLDGDLTIEKTGFRSSGLFAGTGIRDGFSQQSGFGEGGNIAIAAHDISLLDGSVISSSGLLGRSGRVSLLASGRVRIEGVDVNGSRSGLFSNTEGIFKGGGIAVEAMHLFMDHRGAIVAETRGAGEGGDIDIAVERLSLRGSARIDSSTRSTDLFPDPAAGGTVRIEATRWIRIAGRESDSEFSGITAIGQPAEGLFPESAGDAGRIFVKAPRVSLRAGAEISARALGKGDAGAVEVEAGILRLTNSRITTQARTGVGGDIRVRAGFVGMWRNSAITARAQGAGDAGNIEIDAGQEFFADHSRVETEAAASSGGQIILTARERVFLRNSDVATSVADGTGGGGDIEIDPDLVVLDSSRVVARADAGPGGNIRIRTLELITSDDSTIDASSRTGIDGRIVVTSPDSDRSADIATLDTAYRDAAELLRTACAERTESLGSLVVERAARGNDAAEQPLDTPSPPTPACVAPGRAGR